MAAVTELAVDVGTSAACHTLLVPRASYYRARRAASFPVVRVSRPSPVRALQPAERETIRQNATSCFERRFEIDRAVDSLLQILNEPVDAQ